MGQQAPCWEPLLRSLSPRPLPQCVQAFGETFNVLPLLPKIWAKKVRYTLPEVKIPDSWAPRTPHCALQVWESLPFSHSWLQQGTISGPLVSK